MTRGPLTARALLAVVLGGATGGVLRWLVGELLPAGSAFPWSTFVVNVSGSFLLALLPALAAVRRRPVVAVGLGPGLLGGYTTLSAYAEDTRALLADAEPALASGYLTGTVAACLIAVAVAHRFSTPADQRVFEDEEGNE